MDKVPLILLPGLDGTGNLFYPLLNSLPDNIRPVVVSYPKDKPYGYEELKERVMDSLPTENDFYILGESFSGPLALLAAGDAPRGLKGIILCASFVRNPIRFVPPWLSPFFVSPLFSLWPAAIRLRSYLSGGKYDDLAARALEAVRSVRPEVVSARVKAIMRVNVEKELADCPVPVLYLASTRDHLVREHNLRGILRIRSDVKVRNIDTEHFILQLEPDRAAEEIAHFVERTS
jgi:pimeloyl-ACP methyl ester carboxylesterase